MHSTANGAECGNPIDMNAVQLVWHQLSSMNKPSKALTATSPVIDIVMGY